MLVNRAQLFFLLSNLLIHLAHSLSVKDIFKTNEDTSDLLALVRVPRQTHENLNKNDKEDKVSRKVRDSKYYEQNYKDERSLKPEDNAEDDRDTKSSNALGKRCTTCDNGYLRSSYDRGRDRYYDRDPYYYSGRSRYDPYDDYERDGYNSRGRTRYSSSSSYDRYDPRDRYYDRGMSYDSRGYDYYSPYSRDRYDNYSPYDDYYSQGYDSYSSRGYGRSRPEYGGYGGGGYVRGYSYGGDRDRYGSGYGSYGSGSYYGGSRSRYPSNDYDSGYRYTSYLYGRPSSTTTDNPKSTVSDQSNTASPIQGSPSGRSK